MDSRRIAQLEINIIQTDFIILENLDRQLHGFLIFIKLIMLLKPTQSQHFCFEHARSCARACYKESADVMMWFYNIGIDCYKNRIHIYPLGLR